MALLFTEINMDCPHFLHLSHIAIFLLRQLLNDSATIQHERDEIRLMVQENAAANQNESSGENLASTLRIFGPDWEPVKLGLTFGQIAKLRQQTALSKVPHAAALVNKALEDGHKVGGTEYSVYTCSVPARRAPCS